MSEAKPKRKFWQFHLSTVVVMTLVAGGMLGANLVRREVSYTYSDGSGTISATVCGWPDYCFVDIAKKNSTDLMSFGEYPVGLSIKDILINIIECVILFAVVVFAESLIRRREARKT